MSGFTREDYACLRQELVLTKRPGDWWTRNLNLVLSALDIAIQCPTSGSDVRLHIAAPALLAACKSAIELHEDDEGIAGVLSAAIASAEETGASATEAKRVHKAADDMAKLMNGRFELDQSKLQVFGKPEADGDRTVHPAMDRVPATELLRRVTALERLVNDTTAYLVNPSGSKISELARSRDRWLKSRAGEWV
jgi:hypothetical protein